MCCSPWGHRQSDTTERLNWLLFKVWSPWCFDRLCLSQCCDSRVEGLLPLLTGPQEENWPLRTASPRQGRSSALGARANAQAHLEPLSTLSAARSPRETRALKTSITRTGGLLAPSGSYGRVHFRIRSPAWHTGPWRASDTYSGSPT